MNSASAAASPHSMRESIAKVCAPTSSATGRVSEGAENFAIVAMKETPITIPAQHAQ